MDFASLKLDYENGAVINEPVLKNNLRYQVGLNRGDQILEMNAQAIKNAPDFKTIVDKIKIGASVEIKFVQNSVTRTAKFIVKEDPTMEILLQEKPTDTALKNRKDWLTE